MLTELLPLPLGEGWGEEKSDRSADASEVFSQTSFSLPKKAYGATGLKKPVARPKPRQ
jgi:hypothetical protein